MASQSDLELLSSLKDLLSTGQYSDLTIASADEQHQVHKVIVCPRSHVLTKLCSDLDANKEQLISIPEEDSQAVQLMIHYLYTLDYPQVTPRTQVTPKSPEHQPLGANGTNGANGANGTNGTHPIDPKQSNGHGAPLVSPVEYSIEQEEFIAATDLANKAAAKNKKKKKRAQSTPTTTSNLVIHARVYALGSKYGIKGLKNLSADKFEDEVKRHWDTEDFLGAAQEAYTSTSEQDRTIRDSVLNTIKSHPELLGRKQVQEVIKKLELSFDLLMHHLQNSTGTLTK
ncbi:uncharacterized protein BCR38DRAFT_522484 [Pseudomassariella vexata]|uniref:BTB domain-containing protein n=1 Tax=Pseudomassariella vexata TaxID=1141098 RepID=A0A1Y2E8H8_9PEZI|nr:uncharacterized protein BCR38DRAFT_522484 [Pseudomassariella vexata]ORY67586.1 hypothetical protein BCR38DRAFT_522484 [Pseudomassariella vexata]